MNESMIPAFAKGEFAEGVESGLGRLMNEGRNFVAPKMDARQKPSAG